MRLASRLACPACHARLGTIGVELRCTGCGRAFPVDGDVPDLLVRDLMTPAQLVGIDEWNEGTDEYRRVMAVANPVRFYPIDRPLLARAVGDVLEVGCGDGRLLRQLAARQPRSLLGIDVSRDLLRAAHARGLDVARGAAECLPLPDASFDAVVSGYYALRYTDLGRSLPEIARVLRPGGVFGLTLLGRWAVRTVSRLTALALLPRAAHRRFALDVLRDRESIAQPTDVRDADHLRGWFDRAGLEIEQVLGTPYLPLVTSWLGKLFGGRMPYLRGDLAARHGFDVVVLGRRPG